MGSFSDINVTNAYREHSLYIIWKYLCKFIFDLRGIFNINEKCSVVLCAKCLYCFCNIFDHDFHIFKYERFWVLTLHKYVHWIWMPNINIYVYYTLMCYIIIKTMDYLWPEADNVSALCSTSNLFALGFSSVWVFETLSAVYSEIKM
jgi:hypothetical protein